jgi:quercetin dioxygenase-like cupin family protein
MPERYRSLPSSVPLTPAGLAEIADTLAGRGDLWRGVLEAARDGEPPRTAWGTRVAGGEGWEAWLHTWEPGQVGDLHVHDTGAGAVAVVGGELVERVPGRGDRRLREGESLAFVAGHVHRLIAGDAPAVSLHVVARPFSSVSPAAPTTAVSARNAVPDAVTGADPPHATRVVPPRSCAATGRSQHRTHSLASNLRSLR